eukprot:10766285-Alexandrium_andersonii.AAC.1
MAGCRGIPGSAGPPLGAALIGIDPRNTNDPAGASPGAKGLQGARFFRESKYRSTHSCRSLAPQAGQILGGALGGRL